MKKYSTKVYILIISVLMLSGCKLDGTPQTVNQLNSQIKVPVNEQKIKEYSQDVVREINSTNINNLGYKLKSLSNKAINTSTVEVDKTRFWLKKELTEPQIKNHLNEAKQAIQDLKNKVKK